MPKSNNLQDLFLLLKLRKDTGSVPEKADHFLFLLGTDTVFTQSPTIDLVVPSDKKSYERGETLSYTAQVVASIMHETTEKGQPGEALSFFSDSVDVLNGPTTLGSEVGKRIAQAVFLALRAAANGKTNLMITAHSRGAVEALLVMHELERIKNALSSTPEKSLLTILKESPCPYTKAAFHEFYEDDAEEDSSRQMLLQGLKQLKFNAFLIDPVPGGRFMGIPGIAWRDDRFYDKPPCEDYELILYRDERTRCFIPVVPEGMQATVLPGHHGTGSGNIYNQQFIDGSKQAGTEAVQDLLLCKLLYFFGQKSSLFTSPVKEISLAHKELDAVANAFFSTKEDDRLNLMLEHYKKIHGHDDAYLKFAEGAYAYLGREYAKDNQRWIHFRGHFFVSLAEVSPVVKDFVNVEHVKLYLQDYIQFDSNDPVLVLVEAIKSELANTIIGMHPKNSKFNLKLSKLMKDENGSTVFFNGLAVLVEHIGQKYLRNHLADEEKLGLMDSLKSLFELLNGAIKCPYGKDVSDKDENKKILLRCVKIIQDGLKGTIETHYNSIIGQIKHTIKEMDYYLDPHKEFNLHLQQFISSSFKGSDNLLIQQALSSLKQSLSALGEKPSIEDTRSKMDEQLALIKDSESLTKEEKQQLFSNLFSGHKILLAYLAAEDFNPQQHLKKIEELYQAASDLRVAFPELAELIKPSSIDIEFSNIDLHKLGLVFAGGKLLQFEKYDLSQKPEDLSESFFDKLKQQAIGQGAVSPEQLALQEKNTSLQGDVAKLENGVVDVKAQLAAQVQVVDSQNVALRRQEEEFQTQVEEIQADLQRQKKLVQQLNTPEEQACAQLIHHRLLPVSENYRSHLWREAAKYHSGLDSVCGEALPEAGIDNETTKASYDSIRSKFGAVQELITVLKDKDTKPLASDRLQLFTDTLKEKETLFKKHRDGAWIRFSKTCFSVLGIIVTGIIPGVIALAVYSKVKDQKSPLFFNHTSRGEQFAEDCKAAAEPSL